MPNLIKDFYKRQLFSPGILGIFLNPFYIARKGLFVSISEMAYHLHGRLLDVGCGTKPYQSIFSVDEYIGIDIDSDTSRQRGCADYIYDGISFPFEGNTFDSILCNQVLEHVFNPEDFVQELNRVLKPSGKLLLTVPFVWDEHEQPHDYARYSSYGLRALLEKHGLKVIEQKKLGADASIIFQLTNAYLYKVTQKAPRPIRFLLTVSIMALFNLTGILVRRLLPSNPDLFLDQLVIAEKPC